MTITAAQIRQSQAAHPLEVARLPKMAKTAYQPVEKVGKLAVYLIEQI
jgi:hypothetical protein